MLGYLEYIYEYCNIPIGLILVVVVFFAISNLIGEILELKGKVVPEFVKFRKYFARKKQERETLSQLPEVLDDAMVLIKDMRKHYDQDNIAKRNKWISDVEDEITADHFKIKDIEDQIDRIEVIEGQVDDSYCKIQNLQSEMSAINKTLENINNKMDKSDIEDKRTEILNFYYRITKNEDGYYPSKEEFKRADRLYKEYEELIERMGDSNGEVDTAYKIIQEEFEKRMRDRSFVEDIRWSK